MNDHTIDQTTHGYASGGFAPTYEDTMAFRSKRAEMDGMSDYMQNIDPTMNRTIETMIRAKVRGGADPAEARRAAFGSASGQFISDAMLAARRTPGLFGQGDPISTGRNYLQGVSGGGFSLNVRGPGGSVGMNQSVMGGGLLSGLASKQMAKDVMTNLYGAGGSDPQSASGFNMEESSGIFRTLAERGNLGNIGDLKTYSEDSSSDDYKLGAKAVNDKLNIARRQEGNALVKDALKGTTAENIDSKIQEALKNGDTQIANALSEIQSGSSSFALDDKNTKRVSEVTKETLKGLANLKDVYGELNSQQLLAKMEAITGITISNQDEARKASNMTRSIANTAAATGHDPRAVQEMMLARSALLQEELASRFGADLGRGGPSDAAGRELTGGMNKGITEQAMKLSAAGKGSAEALAKSLGIKVRDLNEADMTADITKQTTEWTDQNSDVVMMMGQGQTTLKGDRNFQAKSRSIQERLARAKDLGEREALNDEARELNIEYNGKGADEMLETEQGKRAFAAAPMDRVVALSTTNSSMAVRNDRSDTVIKNVMGDTNPMNDTISEAFKRMGRRGIEKLGADGKLKSEAERKAALDAMVKDRTLSQAEADAMGTYTNTATAAQFNENATDVSNSSAAGMSFQDMLVANAEVESRTTDQQRAYQDGNGKLSLKSVINDVLTGGENGGANSPKTSAQKMSILEALQNAGLGGDLKKAAKVNFNDGISKEEMDGIRGASGNKDLDIHTTLDFDSEEDMLAASKDDAEVRRQMKEELAKDTSLEGGGTSDNYSYRSNDVDEQKKQDELRANGLLAMKYGNLQGVENFDDASTWTAEMKEIAKTGKVSGGGIGIDMEVDAKGQRLYDNDGDTSEGFWGLNMNWNDEKNNPEDKVYLKNAAKFNKLAGRFNSKEEGADMLKLDGMNNNEMRNDMEAQLEILKDRQKAGAKIIETGGKNEDGSKEQLDMGAAIKNLTEAIAKAKADDGKGQVVQHMTVTKLYCDEIGPKSK